MVCDSLNPKYFELIPVYNPISATQGLNVGIEQSNNDLVICCHQDVKFPINWHQILLTQLSTLENVGVVGTFGRKFDLKCAGYIYNPYPTLRKSGTLPCEALTLDEHCLILYKSFGLRFDESCPYFHVYGADICLSAIEAGFNNYIIYSTLEHLSAKGKYDPTFRLAVEWLLKKWYGRTSITKFRTMCFEVDFETGNWHHYL